MRPSVIVLSSALLMVPIQASSQVQAETPIVLWRDLQFGDDAATVAAKLRAVGGIKRVDVKVSRRQPGESRLLIAYTGAGIEIFGELFTVMPSLIGGRLTRVDLSSEARCASDAYPRFRDYVGLLREKYPQPVPSYPPLTEADFFDAIRATDGSYGRSIATALTNGSTVAMISAAFSKSDPPERPLVTGKLARALHDMAWDGYLADARECGGTGALRSSFSISYIRAVDFKASERRQIDAQSADKQKALDNL